MKRNAIVLGCAFAVAGCSMASEEDRMENAIRAELSKTGTVKQVEMTKEGANLTGFAEVRTADGSEGRLNCTATPDTAKGSGAYNWRCQPAIDQRVIDSMKNTIRQSLAQQAEVTAIELARQDDSRMTGHAILRGPDGEEVRTECTATRASEGAATFNWQCAPAGEAAPAEAAEAAPAE
ncbi:MAG TPA: hypothetical protein VEW71_08295 [Allosphingosinicella sp.]|nr:hypothetical protein [Allosphingosinicella sp.]